jgi:hypothetical protein
MLLAVCVIIILLSALVCQNAHINLAVIGFFVFIFQCAASLSARTSLVDKTSDRFSIMEQLRNSIQLESRETGIAFKFNAKIQILDWFKLVKGSTYVLVGKGNTFRWRRCGGGFLSSNDFFLKQRAVAGSHARGEEIQ